MILLDSDVAVDVLRGYAPALDWIGQKPVGEIILPGFVVMELMEGCSDGREMRRLREKLRPYGFVWPPRSAYKNALALFAKIHLSHGTGIIDTLIGVTAVHFGEPLHPFNEKHYRPVPGLQLAQPYERPV